MYRSPRQPRALITGSGLAVVGGASLAGGFTASAAQLIAARAVMGLGAAMTFPATLSVLTNVFTERRERAAAIGLWGAVAGVAIAMGPIVGGWLLAQFPWGSVFIAMAPVAAFAAALMALAFVLVWVIIVAIGAAVSSSGNSDSSGGSSDYNAPSGVVKGTTGQALTLYGFQSGEKMNVTLTKVIPDAQPGDQFSAPSAGDRLYAVQFKLADSGSAAYDDSPSNGTRIVNSAGKSFSPTFMIDSVTGCPMFAAVEQIAAGGSRQGCMAFQIPATAKITAVRFTLDSGLASQTGQWSVAG